MISRMAIFVNNAITNHQPTHTVGRFDVISFPSNVNEGLLRRCPRVMRSNPDCGTSGASERNPRLGAARPPHMGAASGENTAFLARASGITDLFTRSIQDVVTTGASFY